MTSEKKGTKGRFLYLFDWHNKSRKKLFPNNYQTSGSNEGKENLGDSIVSQSPLRDSRFSEDAYPTKASGNNIYTPSINGDDGYGSKAPGVVARLMGLESLPTSGETSSICSHDFESHDLGSSYYPRNASAYQHDHHALDYSYMANRLEGYHWNSVDSRSNMVHDRPIERFQTEVLPPKSAKPISITHHKLLSPIKSPGFIHTNDTNYIIEAAARIIDSAPQATPSKRTPSFGSASSPFKIRDLREKMEAAHRSSVMSELSKKSKQSPTTKHLRGNPPDRLLDTPFSRSRTSNSETSGSSNSTRKGKSVSPAVRAKDNVPKKDGSTSSTGTLVKKEHKQLKPKQSFNRQPTAKKSRQTYKSPRVLRQNTEKQNSISNKDKATSKSSVPNQQLRGSVQVDGSSSSSKTSNKTLVYSQNGSKKVVSTTVVTEKQLSSNRVKNISKNKELVNKEKRFEEAIAENLLAKRNESRLQRDFAIQTGADNKKAMDVISFTFNSPIKKTGFMSHSSDEMKGSSGLVDLASDDTHDQYDSKDLCSPLLRLKLIGGDNLSLLLDQKLKELTDKVEQTNSQSDSAMDSSDAYSVPSWSGPVSKKNAVKDNFWGPEDWRESNPDIAYNDPDKRKEIEGECSSIKTNKFDTRQGLDLVHLDISVPECSVSHGSCISSNSRSDYTYGNAEDILCQSEEEVSCASTEKFLPVEDERDISDTASSSYYEEWEGKHTSTLHNMSECYLPNWELQYVRQIVHCAGLKELGFDANSNVIDSIVFDQAENLIINSTRNTEECTKLRRKLLFDYLNECICLRWEQISLGSSKAWSRWRVLLQKEDWLVEDVVKEISVLENMQNLVVDELVEKDMGTQYRGWVDFEMDMLEEGIQIERDVVDFLLDELILDISLL